MNEITKEAKTQTAEAVKLSELLGEAAYLLHIYGSPECPDWVDGEGNCNRENCKTCRIYRCIDALEEHASRKKQNGNQIEEILKWLPIIKQIISFGGKWEQIKGICEPIGLTDTAFREFPKVSDYLLDENYWKRKK